MMGRNDLRRAEIFALPRAARPTLLVCPELFMVAIRLAPCIVLF